MTANEPKNLTFEKAPLGKFLCRKVVFYCPNCGYTLQSPYDMSKIKLPDLEVPPIIKNECSFTPNFTIPCPNCESDYLVDIDAGMVEIIRTLNFDMTEQPIKTTACCSGHANKNGTIMKTNRLTRECIEVSSPYIQFAPGKSPLDIDLNILPWMYKNGYWEFKQVEFMENDTDEHTIFFTPKDRGVILRFNREIIDDVFASHGGSFDVDGAINTLLSHFTEARQSLLTYIQDIMVPRWNHDAILRWNRDAILPDDPRFEQY